MLANTTGLIVNGNNAAEMIAADVLNGNFNTCVDTKFSEIEDNWNTYSVLTVAGGRIRLIPGTKVNIRSFVQWARDKIRQDKYPSLNLLTLAERDEHIGRFNTHKKWLEDAVNMANKSMPNNFTENMERMEWKAKLINFLKSQPGRNGVPLNYVIRDNVFAIVRTNMNFLGDYVDRTPLTGFCLNANASKVHSYIAQLISENIVSEQNLVPHKDADYGRVDYISLQ